MRKPRLATVFLVVFVDLIGFGIVIPLLPMLSEEFGASPVLVGFTVASYSIMQFLFAPIWGGISDRYGRRPIILLSLMGSTASYVIFALSQSLEMLIISRMLAGTFAGNISAITAYITDITDESNRTKGMGIIGAAFGLGFIAGPVIAGLLSPWGHAAPGFAAFCICLLNLLAALKFLPESLPPEKRAGEFHLRKILGGGWSEALASADICKLLLIVLISNTAFTLWEVAFALFVKDSPVFGYGMREFAFLVAYVGVMVAFVQGGMIGKLSKRFGEPGLLKSGLLVFAIGVGTLPLSPGLTVLMITLGIMGLGSALIRPPTYSMISKHAAEHSKGSVLGTAQSVSSLSRIFSPILAGLLYEFGISVPFYAASAFLLLGLLLSFMIRLPAPAGAGTDAARTPSE